MVPSFCQGWFCPCGFPWGQLGTKHAPHAAQMVPVVPKGRGAEVGTKPCVPLVIVLWEGVRNVPGFGVLQTSTESSRVLPLDRHITVYCLGRGARGKRTS